MAKRQAPNLNAPITSKVFGVPYTRAPITRQEMMAANMPPVPESRIADYVENRDPSCWEAQMTVSVLSGCHAFVQGPAGTGKNLSVDYLAYKLNRPYKTFSFKKGMTAADWISRTVLDSKGGVTVSREVAGDLARYAAGIKIVRNGKEITVPSIICFSDIDRAEPQQMELLREALEVGKGMLSNPQTGGMFEIAKGTIFIFTANRGLDGDGGTGMLTAPIDASIGNRLRGVETPAPTVDWMVSVIKRAHPELSDEVSYMIVNSVEALKNAAASLFLQCLSLSVRDAVDMAAEFPLYREILGEDRAAVRATTRGIIDKIRAPHDKAALSAAVDVVCGPISTRKGASPMDL